MKKVFHFKRRNPPILWRIKWLLVLTAMASLEFLPIPVTASTLIFVWHARPLWFKIMVDKLYSHLSIESPDDSDLSFFSKYQQQHPKHFDKH